MPEPLPWQLLPPGDSDALYDHLWRRLDALGSCRLTLVIEMDDDTICPVELIEEIRPGKQNKPHRIPGVNRPNPYSKASRLTSKPEPKEVFRSLFDQGTDAAEDTDHEKT